MKRNLALVLVLVMLIGSLFSVIPMAEATEETPAPEVVYKPEIAYANLSYSDKIYMEFAVPAPTALEEGAEVTFPVAALSTDAGFKVGTPVVEGATVTGKVLKNGKGKKIYVLKYKAKKNEKKKIGHRQPYTKVQIVKIEG